MIQRLRDLVVSELSKEGSTRSSALLRIGLVLLVWGRFGMEIIPYYTWKRPAFLVYGLAVYVLSAFVLVGYKTRIATALFGPVMFFTVYGLGLWYDHEPFRHHHVTILSYACLWLAFLPAGGSYSVDRWLAVRRARREGTPVPAERAPVWGLHLIMFQMAVVYFFGAWDKTYWAYPERMEQIFQYAYFGSEAPGAWFSPTMVFLGAATVVLEYVLAFGLYVRRWHWWLMPMGVALHVIIYLSLPVATFTVTMMLLYVAFFDPDDVHAVLDTLQASPDEIAST